MTLQQHDLHHEFPEFKDVIHALKLSNHHFARLFEEYHTTNNEVRRLEGQGVPVSDETFEEVKKNRLKLKDQLYAILLSHQGN